MEAQLLAFFGRSDDGLIAGSLLPDNARASFKAQLPVPLDYVPLRNRDYARMSYKDGRAP